MLAVLVGACGRDSYGEDSGPVSVYGDCDRIPSNGYFVGENGHCYTYHEGPVDRGSAIATCVELGGNLTELQTQAEADDVLMGLDLSRPVWFGVAFLSGAWGWISGEPLLSSNWEAEPSTANWTGAVLAPDGLWRQTDTGVLNAFSCEFGWIALGADREIALFTLSTPWDLAQQRCIGFRGDLAVLKTPSELATARQLAYRIPWIGLQDPELDGFEWVDGTPVDEGLWATNQPGSTDGCAGYNASTGLVGYSCTDQRMFLCERPAN